MSFVRAKEIPPRSGNWYDYEVCTIHERGKVMQKVIQYLGKSGTSHRGLIGDRVDTIRIHGISQPIMGNHYREFIPKVVCKHCKGQHTRKYGLYKGVTQYYYCDDCNKKFVGTDALPGHRVSPSFIASALNEYYDGLSFHDIENNIERQTDTDISHTAINKWVDKYTNEAIKQTKNLHPEVGNTWIADETYIRIDKSKDRVINPYDKSRKAKWVVFWDIIDADTRFLLASHVTSTRSTQDAKILMEKAAKRAGKTPKVVVTDSLAAYLDGIELAFGGDTKHKQGEPFSIENNTNLIERFHGSIKERTKVMRALKNKKTLQRFMDGWLVHYNFFRPHMSLNGRTPAEEAGIKYENRSWADIVGYEKKPIVQTLEPEFIKNTEVKRENE
jgi:putative transposase